MSDRSEPTPATAGLDEMLSAVQSLPPASDDTERIERVRQFEVLKSAIAAAQLSEAVAFDASQRAVQAVAGVASKQQGRGVASQLGLATAQSPWRAARWLGWGTVLTRELPVTFAELRAGHTTEWRALLVARETVWLSREDRAEVDTTLGPRLRELGDRQVENLARAHAQRLDPAGAVERRRVAQSQRRVSLRPRPDTMSSLSATTSIERGVQMYAQLRRDADALVGTGQAQGRTRDQVMADLVYERLTGLEVATGPAIEVELLITADTLLGTDHHHDDTDAYDPYTDAPYADDEVAAHPAATTDAPLLVDLSTHTHDTDTDTDPDTDVGRGFAAVRGGGREGPPSQRSARSARSSCSARSSPDEPALLTAAGLTPVPIPAPIARALIATSSQTWLRRLFTCPDTGDLLAMESRRRVFSDGLKKFIRYRDQYCSTPFCGAPIRHADHAHPAEDGGATSAGNGNGKCAGCNWAKQAPGWRHTMTVNGRGTITTPTGHTYRISPPRLPGQHASPDAPSPILDYFWSFVRQAA